MVKELALRCTSTNVTDHTFKTGDDVLPYRDALLRRGVDKLRIESARVVLRPILESDLMDVFSGFTREVAALMTPQPADKPEDTMGFIKWAIEGRHKGTDLQLVIEQQSTGEFLGCVGLHTRYGGITPEIGVWVKKDAQGNKYGFEAVQAIKVWAEQNLKIDYFNWPVATNNTPSRNIAELLGGNVVETYSTSRTWGPTLEMVRYQIPVNSN